MQYDASIEVLAPTKGRPTKAAVMAESWDATRVSKYTGLTLVLDKNDPRIAEYVGVSMGRPWWAGHYDTGSMVHRANLAARTMDHADIIGFAADDNVFRTRGWDDAVRMAFADPKITTVNTNDLLVGDSKGGVYFIRNDAIKALGWFLPPFLEHLYVDFAVTELAKRAGTYAYLDDVIIEHMHPYSGTARWDDQYLSYNNPAQDHRDGAAFYNWWNGPESQKAVEALQCLS